MSKKIKLNLDDLKVKSFVTQPKTQEKIKGGGASWSHPDCCDWPTINDSCFSWCDDICDDYPTGAGQSCPSFTVEAD